MRKHAVIVAAAGLALCGSVARADFVISSTRTAGPNAGQETVKFFVQNQNSGDTLNSGGLLAAGDFAILAPTTPLHPDNGLFVSVTGGGVLLNSGTLTTFGVAGLSQVTAATLKLAQTTPGGVTGLTGVTQLQGIGQSFNGFGSAFADASSPLLFATAVVPTGAPVEVLQDVAGFGGVAPPGHDGNRTILPSFEPGGTTFSPDNSFLTTASNARTTAFVDGVIDVPEPTSVALVGIGLAGLVARRRRIA